jgi:hypothetical protein
MLLITFHGGNANAQCVNNIYAYATPTGSTSPLPLLSIAALADAPGGLQELRGMLLANGYLYVVNGFKKFSNVQVFQLPTSVGAAAWVSTLVAASFSDKGHFENAIAHPFGLVFDDKTCYVSNQDTNTVAQVAVSHHGQNGTLAKGCASAYLNKKYSDGPFVPGTFVASQTGKLDDVKVNAVDVSTKHGGLGATFEPTDSDKVHNSVRDVEIANGILFVCDEPGEAVNMYSLADGAFLGASAKLEAQSKHQKPTHMMIHNGGLYVAAGPVLFWSPLPASADAPTLAFQVLASVTLPPGMVKIGGISFTDNGNVYVPFQTGTGGSNQGGAVYSYQVQQASPADLPQFCNASLCVRSLPDTPEFVLYVPD